MKKQKPLAKVGDIEIHQAQFEPFEMVKYLDLAALKKAPKVTIEIGKIKGGGREATLAAEFTKGKITRLTPAGCEDCGKKKGKDAPKKKHVRAALEKARELGLKGIKLPMEIKSARWIDLGPMTIYTGPFDICVMVEESDGSTCFYCLFGPGLCIGPVVIVTK